MCGIVSYFAWDAPPLALRRLQAMNACQARRGPDAAQESLLLEGRLGLGHTRLAILDLEPRSNQPMATPDGQHHLVFNGELYNFHSLRESLEAAGLAFRTTSDTEVLLQALRHWGEDALARIEGMFAFVYVDLRRQFLLAARDRIGIKPLAYLKLPGCIAFASTITPLTMVPGFDWEIDPLARFEAMALKCVPAPRSIYASIRKVAPGTCLRVPFDGRVREARYWSVADWLPAAGDGRVSVPYAPTQHKPEEAQLDSPEVAQLDSLDAALASSVDRQLVADVEVGVFLSGGIDSSLVAALAQEQTGGVKTFSVAFEVAGYNEAPHARAIADHLGTAHHELTVTAQALLDMFQGLTEIYDEPFGDASAVPTTLLSQFVRSHVKVALSGDGGDEQFFGYGRYHQLAGHLPVLRRVPGWVRRGAAALAAPGRKRVDTKALMWEHRLLGLLGYPDLPRLYGHYGWSWYARLAHLAGAGAGVEAGGGGSGGKGDGTDDSPADWLLTNRCMEASAQGFEATGGDFLPAMMVADILHYLPDDCLVKVDRASMAHSLEVRVPLLDEQVLRQSLPMPMQLKWRDGVWKYALKELLARRVPRALFDRPKMGFGVPLDHWLFHELREFTEALLDKENCQAAGLDFTVIQALKAQHLSGEMDHQYFLWPVCCLVQWTLAHASRRQAALAGLQSGHV